MVDVASPVVVVDRTVVVVGPMLELVESGSLTTAHADMIRVMAVASAVNRRADLALFSASGPRPRLTLIPYAWQSRLVRRYRHESEPMDGRESSSGSKVTTEARDEASTNSL